MNNEAQGYYHYLMDKYLAIRNYQIEDIYPLTIIMMRESGKILIVNANCNHKGIQELQTNNMPLSYYPPRLPAEVEWPVNPDKLTEDWVRDVLEAISNSPESIGENDNILNTSGMIRYGIGNSLEEARIDFINKLKKED